MKKYWWISLAWFFQVYGQSLSCSLYEVDGVPGYSQGDLMAAMSYWNTPNLIPDWDQNGKVNILDFLQQMDCRAAIGHGLIASYYGFNTADGPDLTNWPDISGLNPTVIRATENIFDDRGWDGLMDSGFTENFMAVYQGWLYVPENATYTIRMNGSYGARLYLDDEITPDLSYLGGPRQGEYISALSQGFHTIKIDFLRNDEAGSLYLDWSSNGSIIPFSPIAIDQNYLFHDSVEVPEGTVTNLKLIFEPASGTRVTSASVNVKVFALGPNSDLILKRDGVSQNTIDGEYDFSLNLSPGLNTIQFDLSDDQGRSTSKAYHIYRDSEPNLTPSTLAANVFATEWFDGTIPDLDSLTPIFQYQATSVNLTGSPIATPNGTIFGGDIVEFVGTIAFGNTDTFEFKVNNSGALFIDGEFVCGRGFQFQGQWDPEGKVDFSANQKHSFRYIVLASDQSIDIEVRRPSSSYVPIEIARFRSGPQHYRSLVPSNPKRLKTGGRVSNGMLMEYLFHPDNFLGDTGPYDFNLWPDPRVISRIPSGATFRIGSGLSSERAGVYAISKIKEAQEFTLEADLILDQNQTISWSRKSIIKLCEPTWGDLAGIRFDHDHLVGFFDGPDISEITIDLDNFVQAHAGQRVHLALVLKLGVMRLYVNGTEMGSINVVSLSNWPNLGHFALGGNYSKSPWQDHSNGRNQFQGTMLVASVYNRRLTTPEIATNISANQALAGTPNPISFVGLSFPPAGNLNRAHHVLNRLAFGPTTDELRSVLQNENAWIAEQLNPSTIDDSEWENFFASGIYDPNHNRVDVVSAILHRQATSKKQLLEVITQFWENHFSTQMDKTDNPKEEFAENLRFRELAFGDFRDLVLASAFNWPMTVYLDSDQNKVGAPNENYARELFELHTLGVNNGYTQQDIVEAARCFTGCSTDRGKFVFDPSAHDFGSKTLFNGNLVIPAGGGLSDCYAVINYLMDMPECAEFISYKLCELLVSDTPSPGLRTAAQTAFTNSNGNIATVLQAIIGHSEFQNTSNYGTKVKSPLEFVLSAIRSVGGYPGPQTLRLYVRDMGMDLMNNPFPTGYEEVGDFWVNTGSLFYRWNFVHDLITNRGTQNTAGVDLEKLLALHLVTSGNEITDLFMDLTTHGSEAPAVPGMVLNYLTDNNPGSFVLNPTTLDQNVRHALLLTLRLPEFNKQ
ncbi:MAG: DUF1800 family protein [Acidobacteria bacterium]|nr:DUF1800 family protein [Acidobacteriota bacterium]MCB9399471.1 DUF1800 family protein [Acidobacteriota bacterium]